MNLLQTVLQTLAGIIASFVLFWGSIIPGLQPRPAPVPATTETSVATTTTVTTQSETKPSQKNGLVEAKPTRGPFSDPVSSQPVTTPPVAKPLAPTKSQEQINIETRAALVNILCLPRVGLSTGISGSGVIIDSRGVILTNAHVAQYFLLRDYLTPNNVSCVIRTGSPAQAMYTATLIYLPPAWVAANASQLKAAQALGTGENDFAFLLITGRTNAAAQLPSSFAHLAMDRSYVDIGYPMLLAGYPAGFLGAETVEKSLYASSAVTYVAQLFSFTNDTKRVDLFSIGGTVVSQGGSSGGAAVRLQDGTLAGVIVTETSAATTDGRDLRAVSLAHIDDALVAQGKGGITALLTGDLSAKAAIFNAQVAPGLTAQLESVLNGN